MALAIEELIRINLGKDPLYDATLSSGEFETLDDDHIYHSDLTLDDLQDAWKETQSGYAKTATSFQNSISQANKRCQHQAERQVREQAQEAQRRTDQQIREQARRGWHQAERQAREQAQEAQRRTDQQLDEQARRGQWQAERQLLTQGQRQSAFKSRFALITNRKGGW